MKWASAIAVQPSAADALAESVRAVRAQFADGISPDLVLLFVSSHHRESWELIAKHLVSEFPQATVIGCSSAGVIGGAREVEDQPAISLTAAHLPGAELTPFHLSPGELPSPDAPPEVWRALAGVQANATPQFLLFVEPFSTPVERVLEGLDYSYGGGVMAGGLASGGYGPGDHALFLNGRVFSEGVVGVALGGNVVIDTVVAQGCRPVGHPLRVTKADGNLLLAVDNEPPMNVLLRLYERMSPQDQALVQRNLFLGIAMDPLQDQLGAGDFLIRNLVGGDSERGILAVGAHVQEGQLVQFHVRDATTAREDLVRCLETYAGRSRGQSAMGAVLFSCTGRGIGLYRQPDHDSTVFQQTVGSLPLGGFFCNGEIGPVAGTTYLHSYTSSFAIFRPRSQPD